MDGIPSDAAVYHFHPIGLTSSFYAPSDTLAELIQKIGDIISLGEGTYESYNTGTHGKHGKVVYALPRAPQGTVTGKTINEILASASLPPENHDRLYTTGKYQTIAPTLAAAKAALGLSGEEKYDAQTQERVYRDFLFDQTPGLSDFVKKGKGSVDEAQLAAARQWASIAVPKGLRISKNHGGLVSDGTLSYYEDPGQNGANMKSTNKLRAVLEEVQQLRNSGGL